MYRILLLLIVFFSLAHCADAQFTKGIVVLGGSLSYYTSTSSNSANPNLSGSNHSGYFNVSAGKAISENSVFGIIGICTLSSSKSTDVNSGTLYDYTNNTFGGGVFYAVYKNIGGNFFVFGQVSGIYTGDKQTTKNATGQIQTSVTGWSASIGGAPGIAYKLSNKFLMQLDIPGIFSAAYGSSESADPSQNKSKNTSFGITTSLTSNPLSSLGLGFRVML